MKKIIFSSLMLCALVANAQETYESATIADKDLNGTARYVGMGGAMEALGADISTMSTNPAGIGMFRKSQASMSFGMQNSVGERLIKGDNTTMSFDQLGIVYASQSNSSSFLNFGFNYHKSKNFNQILSAANKLQNASQNKLSYIKGLEGVFYMDTDMDGYNIGWENAVSSNTANTFSQVDYLYYNNFLDDGTNTYYYTEANGFETGRTTRGYIGTYDFNISGNINNRVYLGLTFGVHDVHYRSNSCYTESLVDGTSVELDDDRRITGTGYDIKFGAIVRPVATSPFRIGAYINTPTWYELTTENTTSLNGTMRIGETYDFKLYTPWTFGLSLGHTLGSSVALGATYEYCKYSALDNRVIDGGYVDSYGDWQNESSSDYDMNEYSTEYCLKGVHTLKVGAEWKVVPEFSLRVGYNYLSPKFSVNNGWKDGTIDSYGTYYASQTDYINWKQTNRLTFGVGYTNGAFSADLAYQYSQTNGEYFPFMSYYSDSDSSLDNVADRTDVSNKRHQLLLTLGYRF